MNTYARALSARAAHRFYRWFAIAAFAIVVLGFARTYYLKVLFGTPSLPWLLHLHGALMSSWFALFVVQTSLIETHRVRAHKRLGIAGAALACLMVIVGVTVARRGAQRELHHPSGGGPPPLQLMGFVLFVLLVFAILVTAALLLRRRRDYHKRLMLLSCLGMVGPGLARIDIQQVPIVGFLRTGGPFGLFGLDLLLVYACIGYDTWRNRRLHPAFAFGALLLALFDLPFIWKFLSSSMWMDFAARIAS